MENETVSVSFDNVVADHLAASHLYYKSTAFAKLDKVVAVILLLVAVLGTWAVGVRWWTVIFFPLAFLEWFNLLSLQPLVVRRGFTHNPKFRETYHVTFDRTGIHFTTQTIDSQIAWDHYTKVLEDDRIWLLVYGRQMYSVIPKRAFTGDEEMERFRSLVVQNIVNRKAQPTLMT